MLWLAQFVSNIGTFMQGVGAVWVLLELHQSAEPDTPLAVPTGGGPVFVTITYQVQPGAEDDFQQAVRPIGWSRRTGAVSWMVLQHASLPGGSSGCSPFPAGMSTCGSRPGAPWPTPLSTTGSGRPCAPAPNRTWSISSRHQSRITMTTTADKQSCCRVWPVPDLRVEGSGGVVGPRVGE